MCKLIYGSRSSSSYQEKLKSAGLLSSKTRRLKYDLISVYKMKNNLIDLNFDEFFKMNHYKKTIGNVSKVVVPKSNKKIRRHYFTCSIIKHWNQLKSNDINARNINFTKKKVKRYMARQKV